MPPERIGIPFALAEALADWRGFRAAFDALWLDSGEFETWARDILLDPASPPNVRGLKLVADLTVYRPAYLLWFEDAGSDNYTRLAACPRCGGDLLADGRHLLCKSCSIAVLG